MSSTCEITLQGEIKFCTFTHFNSTGLVVHGFTCRTGGVSTGPYASLNTAFHVGDSSANVLMNRELVCRALGMDAGKLVAGTQVHGDGVRVVEKRDLGRGALCSEDSFPDTDALITGQRGVPISSYYADCVPVFVLDPVKKAVAVSHAGWKGTALRIACRTVEKMKAAFGTDPADCLAGIGPSIGPCCYEVDETVAGRFRENFVYWDELVVPASPGKWRLNLWEFNRRILLEAGVKSGNIVTAAICTSCRNDLFFSYRAQGGTAGRAAALIMLK